MEQANRKRHAMDEIGRKRWAIAEGYIPSGSCSSDRALVSHETACILNTGDREAHIAITIFFANREPAGLYRVVVPPRRTFHLRFNDDVDRRLFSGLSRRTAHANLCRGTVVAAVRSLKRRGTRR